MIRSLASGSFRKFAFALCIFISVAIRVCRDERMDL